MLRHLVLGLVFLVFGCDFFPPTINMQYDPLQNKKNRTPLVFSCLTIIWQTYILLASVRNGSSKHLLIFLCDFFLMKIFPTNLTYLMHQSSFPLGFHIWKIDVSERCRCIKNRRIMSYSLHPRVPIIWAVTLNWGS